MRSFFLKHEGEFLALALGLVATGIALLAIAIYRNDGRYTLAFFISWAAASLIGKCLNVCR